MSIKLLQRLTERAADKGLLKECAILGSYPRHLLFGESFGDIDLLLIPPANLEEELQEYITCFAAIRNINFRVCEETSKVFSRIVLSFEDGRHDADISISKADDISSDILGLDCNISQFGVVGSLLSEPVFLGHSNNHPRDVGLVFNKSREESPERVAKMTAKYNIIKDKL